MEDLGLGVFGLCCMPVLDGAIEAWRQGRLKLVVLSGTLEGMPPVFIAKAKEPRCLRLQRFGKSDCRPLISS